MNNTRIEYFMNVMLYFTWLHEKNFSISTQRVFDKIIYFFSLIFFTKNSEKIFTLILKIIENYKTNQTLIKRMDFISQKLYTGLGT